MTNPNITGPACCDRPDSIRGYGNPAYGVVLLGIAPGADEVPAGRPFVGPAGRLLDRSLDSVKWSRERIYATNCLCWVNNAPSTSELALCRNRLTAELHSVQPKLIVTVGDVPTFELTGRHTGACRGIVQWNEEFSCWVLPTYHTSAVLRGGADFIYDIVRDLAKIEAVRGWPRDIGKVAWKVADAHLLAEFNKGLAIPKARPRTIAVDIETGTVTEDDPHGPQEIVCASFAFEGETALVVRGADLKRIAWGDARDIAWTFHGGMFDIQGLRRHFGIRIPIVHDSLLQSYSLDERTTGIHGLDSLAGEYCGGEFYKEATQEALKHGAAGRIEPELLYERNAKDAAYTFRLKHIFEPEQKADGVWDMYQHILIPAANMFADVQYRGVHIDAPVAAQLTEEWTAKYADMESQLNQTAMDVGYEPKVVRHRYKPRTVDDLGQPLKGYYTEVEPFNPRSPKQVGYVLYDLLGFRGGPSTDEAHLKAIGEQAPNNSFITGLLDYRAVGQMLTHYLQPLPAYVRHDGRLHSRTLLHGTNTGRLSYREPPLQTIPHYTEKEVRERQGDLSVIRRVFAASDDDHVIVEADYGQIEVWMAAAYAADEHMFRDLRGADYHGAVAERIFRQPKATTEPSLWDLRRQAAKVVTFGNMYGTEAPSLAARIGVTITEARAYLDEFFREYAALAADIEATRDAARRQGYVSMVSGRKRRYPLVIDTHALRQAYNAKIQGTASDYTLTSAIELHPLLAEFDSYILFLVHDSIVVEAAKRYLTLVIDLMQRVMERPRFKDFPAVKVDVKYGPNWYDTKKWDAAVWEREYAAVG